MSCEKETVDIVNESSKTGNTFPTLAEEDGMFVFDNFEQFDTAIHLLTEDRFIEYINSTMSFSSLKQKIDFLTKEFYNKKVKTLELMKYFNLNDNLIELNYPFYHFSYLLNSEGDIKIGKQVIRFTKEYVYSVQEENKNLLSNTELGKEVSDKIFVSKVKKIEQVISDLESRDVVDECVDTSSPYTFVTRIVGAQYCVSPDYTRITIAAYLSKQYYSYGYGSGSTTLIADGGKIYYGSSLLWDAYPSVNQTKSTPDNSYLGLWIYPFKDRTYTNVSCNSTTFRIAGGVTMAEGDFSGCCTLSCSYYNYDGSF